MSRVRSYLRDRLQKHGVSCARDPIKTILICGAVITSACWPATISAWQQQNADCPGCLSAWFWSSQSPTDFSSHPSILAPGAFSSTDNEGLPWSGISGLKPVKTSSDGGRNTDSELLNIHRLYLYFDESRDGSGQERPQSIITKANLLSALEVQMELESHSGPSSLNHWCLRKSIAHPNDSQTGDTCFHTSILDLWQGSRDALKASHDVSEDLQNYNRMPRATLEFSWGPRSPHRAGTTPATHSIGPLGSLEAMLVRRSGLSQAIADPISTAEAISFSYFSVRDESSAGKADDKNFLWQSAVADAMTRLRTRGVHVASIGKLPDSNTAPERPSRFYSFELTTTQQYRPLPAENLLLIFGYAAVILYVIFSLGRMSKVHSRYGLAFTGVVELVFSLTMSVSVCRILGVRLTLVPWEILPFLVVVVGVENMSVLTAAVVNTSISLPIDLRISQGLGHAGLSVTLTVLTDVCVLLTIASLGVDAVRQFCVFASIALIMDYFLQVTFFLSVLSIDLQRLELHDLLVQRAKDQIGDRVTKDRIRRHSIDLKHEREKALNQKQEPLTIWTARRFMFRSLQSLYKARGAKVASLVLSSLTALMLWYHYSGGLSRLPLDLSALTARFSPASPIEMATLKNANHVVKLEFANQTSTNDSIGISLADGSTIYSSPYMGAIEFLTTLNPLQRPVLARVDDPVRLIISENASAYGDYLPYEVSDTVQPTWWDWFIRFSKVILLPNLTVQPILYGVLLLLLKDSEVLKGRYGDVIEQFDSTTSEAQRVLFTVHRRHRRHQLTDYSALHVGEDTAISISVNGQIRVETDRSESYELNTASSRASIKLTSDRRRHLFAVHPSGRKIAAILQDHTVCIWSFEKNKLDLQILPSVPRMQRPGCILWSGENLFVHTSSEIHKFSTSTGQWQLETTSLSCEQLCSVPVSSYFDSANFLATVANGHLRFHSSSNFERPHYPHIRLSPVWALVQFVPRPYNTSEDILSEALLLVQLDPVSNQLMVQDSEGNCLVHLTLPASIIPSDVTDIQLEVQEDTQCVRCRRYRPASIEIAAFFRARETIYVWNVHLVSIPSRPLCTCLLSGKSSAKPQAIWTVPFLAHNYIKRGRSDSVRVNGSALHLNKTLTQTGSGSTALETSAIGYIDLHRGSFRLQHGLIVGCRRSKAGQSQGFVFDLAEMCRGRSRPDEGDVSEAEDDELPLQTFALDCHTGKKSDVSRDESGPTSLFRALKSTSRLQVSAMRSSRAFPISNILYSSCQMVEDRSSATSSRVMDQYTFEFALANTIYTIILKRPHLSRSNVPASPPSPMDHLSEKLLSRSRITPKSQTSRNNLLQVTDGSNGSLTTTFFGSPETPTKQSSALKLTF